MKKIIGFLAISVCTLLVVSGCTTKNSINTWDLVSIVYTATFPDGKIFDQNTEQTPLMFTVWSGNVIKGLDESVAKMKVGKTRIFTITPDKWYGPLYDEMQIQKVAKLIFDELQITPEDWALQKIWDIEGIVRWTQQDENGNTLVLFDVNPRETWDTLKYTITVLAKGE